MDINPSPEVTNGDNRHEEAPIDHFATPKETSELVKHLVTVISLGDCNKATESDFESISDYKVYRAFIALLSEFPELMEEIVRGQEKAREIPTYDFDPGILAFVTTKHKSFLNESLGCIKALSEFRAHLKGKPAIVSRVHLRTYQFHYEQALRHEVPNRDDLYWLKLGKKLGVTAEVMEQINAYLDSVDGKMTRLLSLGAKGAEPHKGIAQEA